jgi:hypothetical protein
MNDREEKLMGEQRKTLHLTGLHAFSAMNVPRQLPLVLLVNVG